MVEISYGSTSRDILFDILRFSTKEIFRFSNISLYNVEGTHHIIWQTSHLIWQRRILVKVPAECYVNGVIEFLCKYLQSAQCKYLAGRRINFESLAFASKLILGQNRSAHGICQLCLPFPLNNSKISGKGLISPLKVTKPVFNGSVF